MTHEDEGKYRLKHPVGTTSDPSVVRALQEKAEDGRVTCAAAHEVAATCSVSPAEVGKTADLLEYRIVRCQMGLFGYSPETKIVRPAEEVSAKLRAQLQRLGASGEITCAVCWSIADELGINKMTVSAACETLGLKIRRCQLGAF